MDQKSWSPHNDAMYHMPGKGRKGGVLTTSLVEANIQTITSALSGRGVNTKCRPVLGGSIDQQSTGLASSRT